MNQKPHSPEFKEQALRKLRERGNRTQQSVANELNICLSTLKGWLQGSKKTLRGLPHEANPLPGDVPATAWGPSERLQALNESHSLSGEALHAWCREKGLFDHQLKTWREACQSDQVSYNSCRNRHCPKCQANAAKCWLEARQADLLPLDYYHVVFTLPAPISHIAYYNKAVVYGLLFEIAAETLITIAADPKHLGAQVGATLVLHTWGSALTHHPHVHGIVPGGGLSPDGKRWVACKPGFFLSVRVLSRLFRRRFLEALEDAHRAGKLRFFGDNAELADPKSFAMWLAPLRKIEWVVYAKRPFAGPEAVLAYLSRYTHRVAIANSRLMAMDERGVTFKWKDYRDKSNPDRPRHKTMTLTADEFMRRFLLHVLPGALCACDTPPHAQTF
jgi:transposase-like protein